MTERRTTPDPAAEHDALVSETYRDIAHENAPEGLNRAILKTAAREARELEQPVEARVLYLCLHGLLHLLGHDHEGEPAERDRMEALEQDLLIHLQTPG